MELRLFTRQIIVKLRANSAAELAGIIDSEIVPLLHNQKGYSRLQEKPAEYNAQRTHPHKLSLSMGIAYLDPKSPVPIEELMTEADEKSTSISGVSKSLLFLNNGETT